MARLRPFAAYRYDLSRVHARDVVTQPYDKITPEMQRAYLERSPYNLVRIILGERHANDGERDNVYTRAAGCLTQWLEAQVLRRDPEPALYPYTQTFRVPDGDHTLTRRGFIALGALEDYAAKVVFRHEQTLTGPKQDRLLLLRATRTHFGQIFMLYSDPSRSVEAELMQRATTPVLEAEDEYGTTHRLFRESDPAVIDRLVRKMHDRQLIIADGHHRYETALSWRDEQRARSHTRGDAPWDWVMMTLVNLDAPGLTILPTHRVIHSLPEFRAESALAKLAPWFDMDSIPIPPGEWMSRWSEIRGALAGSRDGASPPASFAVVLAGSDSVHLLRLRSSVDRARALPGYIEQQRQLDVVLLHEFALERALGIDAEAVRRQSNIYYVREAREALQAVTTGAAQGAFLLNPLRPQQVRDVALAGGVMPQKSTDFYPKLLSGLTMYRVE